ncbi:Uncharacterized protein APZ42_002576 [Daphnia magna]|uniref:Uncharacterized protein n=1 Tax=Daphnia magna TaxID=35525 RepID=A0A164I6J9_9CRUS|nr:Uncharacterized protein APZ42_002576 [Daphnia magna]
MTTMVFLFLLFCCVGVKTSWLWTSHGDIISIMIYYFLRSFPSFIIIFSFCAF